MKKIISIFLVILVTSFLLTACGQTETKKNDKAFTIVTTIFPEYDWLCQLTKGNEKVEIVMLLDKGIDLHSFQPTAEDIIKIKTCDLFVYIGGESDKWVEKALEGAGGVSLNLMESLGEDIKEEEIVEGMEAECEEKEDEEEGPEYDEHIWLSLKNAKILCQNLTDALVKADSSNADLYKNNCDEYVAKIDELDKKYDDTVKMSSRNILLFGDRFPFRYLFDDYGLEYYAAFVGCSAESEASFETITFLSEKVDELGLPVILKIESSDGKIAATVRDNTLGKNQEILTMNSIQSVSAQDLGEKVSYLSLMEENLTVLKEALK